MTPVYNESAPTLLASQKGRQKSLQATFIKQATRNKAGSVLFMRRCVEGKTPTFLRKEKKSMQLISATRYQFGRHLEKK